MISNARNRSHQKSRRYFPGNVQTVETKTKIEEDDKNSRNTPKTN